VLNSAYSQVQAALSQQNVKITTDLVPLPSDSEDWGTAESLQYLVNQEKIKSDVVLISCDIFTNGNLSKLLLRFREHRAALAVLFFQPLVDETQLEVPPGTKSKVMKSGNLHVVF